MKIKILLLLILLGLLNNCISSEWVAPEKPNPQEILFEARDDVENKQYETALLKYVWIHEHSLKYRNSFYGVRSSYAKEEWHLLGKSYPLAREKFNEFRDKAKQQVLSKNDLLLNFSDFQSFNRLIGKQDETVELFLWIEKNVAFMTDATYVFVKSDLMKLDRFDILNKYIKPELEYKKAEQIYKSSIEFNKGKIDESSESMFITEIQQMIIILKKNNRTDEAKELISKASLLITDPRFKMAMESILSN